MVPGYRLDQQDGVAIVTLSRPEVRNALDAVLLESLTTLFREQLPRDAATDVIVLTGEDPAFCAGFNLHEFSADPHAFMALAADPATNPFAAVQECPKPVIGAVNGAAFAGGLELALACDILVASERASFADTHARIGWLSVQGLSASLTAALGPQLARFLSLTAEPIDAEQALRAGLLANVVSHDELLAAATRIAGTIARNDRATVRALKAAYAANVLAPHGAWVEQEIASALQWRR